MQSRRPEHISSRCILKELSMDVHVRQIEGVRFAVEARHLCLISDQPFENGGLDTGMTPPELMLASLGSCAAFYAAEYLRTRKLATSGVEVHVTAEKLKQPTRLGNFQIEVHCLAPLTEEQAQALYRSVHQCLIHNTLLAPPQIQITVNAVQPDAAPVR
jgi:putative redox protein